MLTETPYLTDAQERLARLDPEIPVFILQANDKLAEQRLVDWIRDAEAHGVNKEKIDGARERLKQFRNYEFKKLPD